jgi:hypothetical protein
MPLSRTNVYADAEDLRRIKEAATRRGIPEAEIIREGSPCGNVKPRLG